MPKGCAFSERCSKCMTKCRENVPELVNVNGRQVRCFLYAEEEVK